MILTTLTSACVAFAITFLIASAGVRVAQVPRDFPPFTVLPILAGCVGGALFASITYAIVRAVSQQPEKTFLFIAVIALAVSFSLPLRLSFTRSARFAGVTPAAQMILVLMHTVVATVSVVGLLAKASR